MHTARDVIYAELERGRVGKKDLYEWYSNCSFVCRHAGMFSPPFCFISTQKQLTADILFFVLPVQPLSRIEGERQDNYEAEKGNKGG